MSEIDKIICEAQAESAFTINDFHFAEGDQIWCRTQGVLQKLNNTTEIKFEHIKDFIKDHPELKVKPDALKEKIYLDGALKAKVTIGNCQFRLSAALANRRKITISLRLSPHTLPSLDSLQLPKSYKSMISARKGLILVTGSTNSGKTTTINSSIQWLNENSPKNIIMIEDPVEFEFKNSKSRIIQREVGTDVKNFATGLKESLRQDPDVIVIGELLDFETIKTALDASNTGHLVFATLHTNTCADAVDRILSHFSPEKKPIAASVLSQTLVGVINQTLIPTIKGRLALAAELMVGTEPIRNTIRGTHKSSDLLQQMQTNPTDGHKLMDDEIFALFKQKVISAENAVKHANNSMKMKEKTAALK